MRTLILTALAATFVLGIVVFLCWPTMAIIAILQ
jgi:hypothetical protein